MNRLLRRIACMSAMCLALSFAACSGNTTASAVSHALAVAAAPPIPLTFYEGDDDTEPFTPFFIASGQKNAVMTFGYANNEGGYYITTYTSGTWDEVSISNGFSPSDPLWACDNAESTSTTIAATGTLMARSCADGSVSVFALPNALAVYQHSGPSTLVGLSLRAPVTAFSPDGTMMALTDDDPAGAGHTITLLNTTTWQTLQTITVSAGLLSRPSWSADGSYVAAVDLTGKLHVWSASSGAEVTAVTLPAFSVGTAANDVAGPAPLWSSDGGTVYAFTPTYGGTEASAWSFNGSALVARATTHIAFTLNQTTPQIAPDGAHLFMQTGLNHAQIFTASLAQVADFALAGNLVLWTDAKHLAVFTTNASVVVMQLGA